MSGILKSKGTFVCQCGNCYTKKTNLIRHQKKKGHKAEVSAPTTDSVLLRKGTYVCRCGKRFTKKTNLIRHQKKEGHSDESGKLICPVGQCNKRFPSMSSLCQHVKDEHKIMESIIEMHSFTDVDQFTAWKSNLEKTTNSSYVQHFATKKKASGNCTYFYCNRSGHARQTRKSSGDYRKKRMLATKNQGSCKVEVTCTAHISITVNSESGEVLCKACTFHVGHANDLGHLRLSSDIRYESASQLQQGVTVSRTMRDRFDSSLERDNLSCRYDKWKSAERKTINSSSRPLSSHFAKTHFYGASHFRQKKLESGIVNQLIIGGNLSISTVERSWFRQFMKVVDPKFAMPSRRKIVDMLQKACKDKREALRKKLLAADFISLTLDMWSDRSMLSFMGTTVHFLNEDMQFESYVLDMSSFTASHTGDQIANHCLSVVEDFDIRRKVTYVVTDNAANMLEVFKSMSELFGDTDADIEEDSESTADGTADDEVEIPDDRTGTQLNNDNNEIIQTEIILDGEQPLDDEVMEQVLTNLRSITKIRLSCGIHSLQLVVTDGLKCAKFMSSILSKACRLATLIHTNGTFRDKFVAIFRNTIPSTSNTRWNSVYLQLEALSKVDFSRLQTLLSDQKQDVCMLTKRENSILLEVVTVLEPAYTATLIMEEEAALVSVVGPSIISLHKQWLSMSENAEYCQSLAKGLLESLEKRFCGLLDNLKPLPPVDETKSQYKDKCKTYGSGPFGNLIYVVAPTLDPDFRLEWLNDWQNEHDMSVKSRVTAWTVNYAKHAIDSAASKSLSGITSASSDPVALAVGVAEPEAAPPASKRAKLFTFVSQSRTSSSITLDKLTVADVKQQLSLFTSDEGVPGKGLAILNEKRFAGLKPLARQLFTASASSAASKRLFSQAGHIVRPNRAKLSKDYLSKLVFLNCNVGKLD